MSDQAWAGPATTTSDAPLIDESQGWLRAILDRTGDAVSIFGADGQMHLSAGQPPNRLGYDHGAWESLDVWALIHPDDQRVASDGFAKVVASPRTPVTLELRVMAADGSWAVLVATASNHLDDPDIAGIVVTTRDITPVRRAERLASSQASVLELIARAASLDEVLERCVTLVEDNGVGGRASIYLREADRLEMKAGRAPAELAALIAPPPRAPGRSLCDMAIASAEPVVVADMASVGAMDPDLLEMSNRLGLRAAWSQPIQALGRDEVLGTLSTIYEVVHTPDAHERRVAEVACDLVSIALARVEAEERLAHQARHDALTGLANRTLLLDRLDRALQRHPSGVTVLFCDLDRFKVVNDSLGHGAGDEVLVTVAARLRSVVEPDHTVSRFGGDEFVVLIEDAAPDRATDADRLAARIAAVLAVPVVLRSGQEVHVSCSIGLARAGPHTTGEACLRDADAAMYRAKDMGRNQMAEFDQEMRDAAVLRLEVESDLRHAVQRDELVVHYQPVIDLRRGMIIGAEALVRWRHPRLGLLLPNAFVPIAEETGSIDTIGQWVLTQAVGDMSELAERRRGRTLQIGVNVSARQLDADDLDLLVYTVCRQFDWRPSNVLLEVTESSLSRGLEGPMEVLSRLRALGVQLAIDDFGTGHSSLSRLGRMPVGQIKVDQTFVAAVDGPDPRLVRMVDAVAAVAEALEVKLCAEGVETSTQLAHLRRRGCHMAQGFLFAKPLPIDELAALLETDPRW